MVWDSLMLIFSILCFSYFLFKTARAAPADLQATLDEKGSKMLAKISRSAKHDSEACSQRVRQVVATDDWGAEPTDNRGAERPLCALGLRMSRHPEFLFLKRPMSASSTKKC